MTDHQPLKFMLTNPNPPSGRWSRWIALLTPYNFTVEYLSGSANKVADSLSRQTYRQVASEEDDLESYLCSLVAPQISNQNGRVIKGCYVHNDPGRPLTQLQKEIVITPVRSDHSSLMKPNLQFGSEQDQDLCCYDQFYISAVQPQKRKTKFHRVRKWVDYQVAKTKVSVSRQDPSTIIADCILNFTNLQQKPVGPISKSMQLAGGPEYRKELQKNISRHGELTMGNIRKINGGCTNVLWIYNVNLPKYK